MVSVNVAVLTKMDRLSYKRGMQSSGAIGIVAVLTKMDRLSYHKDGALLGER